MLKTVLAIGVSVAHSADHLDKFLVHLTDLQFEAGIFTILLNVLIHFFSGLFDNIFDTTRLNSAVFDQCLKRKSGDLSSDRIKAGYRDSFRCIINDQVNTCSLFNSPDVSTFSTDDSTLHFFRRKRNNGNSTVKRFILRVTLDSCRNDLTSIFGRFFFGFFFFFTDVAGNFISHLGFNYFHQLITCFLFTHVGNTFQKCNLTINSGLQFFFHFI